MSLIVKNVKREFELPDEGTHKATLKAIEDLGLVKSKFGIKDKALLIFETDQADREGKPRKAFKRYTKTLHPKGALRKAVRAITGEDPGDEFNLAALIGRRVQLLIEHQASEGIVYANVTAIVRAKDDPPTGGAPVSVPQPPNSNPAGNAGAAADVESDDEAIVIAGTTR
jgi:hypothetical protein